MDQFLLQSDINRLSTWAKNNGMSFNTSKCKVIHFGRNNPKLNYFINDSPIEEVTSHEDLGIVVQDDLKSSHHVAKIVKKANAVLGQVRRSFSVRRPEVVVDIYKAFVRPHLEFIAPVWNPWLRKDVALIEGVQRRAIRLISNMTGTYEERLSQLGMTTLETRRRRGDAIQVFKLMKGMDDLDFRELFSHITHGIYTRQMSSNHLTIPHSNLELHRHFFTSRAARLWNDLPQAAKDCQTINSFKAWFDANI